MLGVSQKTVNHHERRTTNPSLELIQRLADILEVNAAEFVAEANDDEAPKKSGPKSHLEQVVERVRRLPRKEQQRVVEQLEDAVARAEQRITA